MTRLYLVTGLLAATLAAMPSLAVADPQFTASAGPACVVTHPGGVSPTPISADGSCNEPGVSGGTAAGFAEARQGHVAARATAAKPLGGNDVPMSGGGTAILDDLVTFSPVNPGGPVPATITARLNLAFSGTLAVGVFLSDARVTACAVVGAVRNCLLSGRLNDGTPNTGFDSSDFSVPAPGFIQTVDVVVPVNQAIEIQLFLEVSTEVRRDGSGTADFLSGLGFPTATDVFVLPPGFTANAPGQFLFDNRYLPSGVPDVTLTSITVAPADQTINVGQTKAFTATGGFSDGASGVLGNSGLSGPLGLVGWWPGDGSADDRVDGRHGTLVNGAAFSPGMVGEAFSLDGMDDRVDIPLEGGVFTTGITMDAWVKPNSIKLYSRVVSREFHPTACTYPFVAFDIDVRGDAGNRAVFFVSTSDAVLHQITGTSVIPIGAFTHLAATYDGSVARLYVNGVLESSLTVFGTLIDSLQPVVIGNAGDACRPGFGGLVEFDGLIDEVELYGRALGASEIQSIFNAGSAARCPSAFGCVAWSSSAAAAAIDASGVATGQSQGTTTITATSTGASAISGSTTLTVVGSNQAPTANAGADQTVEATSPAGAAVTLDGSASFDPEGTTLTFIWTGPFGAVSGASPTVTLPLGTSTVTLTVDDGLATGTDTVAITVVAAAPPDVVIDETTPQSVLDGLINVPACLLLVGTIRPTLVLPNLVSVGDCVNVSHNPALTDVDLIVGGGIGGDLTVSDNSAASSVGIELGGGVGGDLTVSDNSAPSSVGIELGGGVGGDITVSDNSAASIDIGATTIVGDVTVSGNGGSSVTVGVTTIIGDLTVTNNDTAASVDVVVGDGIGGDVEFRDNTSASTVALTVGDGIGGNVVFDGNGHAAVAIVTPSIRGNLIVGAGGVSVSGTTADGTSTVTLANSPATMTVLLPTGAFSRGVRFSVQSLGAEAASVGIGSDGDPIVASPLSAYQFAFEIPTLDLDATLTFDINVGALDAAGQAEFLDALGAGRATLGVRGDAPGSVFQAFAVCSTGGVPTTGGCVSVIKLDALGQVIPDGDSTVPTTVRFIGVTGHFSSFAVVLVTPIPDTVPPVIADVPAPIVAEATSAAGTVVAYAEPTAIDDRDGDVAVNCAPASGSTFPLGTTTVTCGATDFSGNSSSSSFTVTVRDTTPPALACPPSQSVSATSPTGAIVSYPAATVSDTVDAAPVVTYSRASGTLFPIGTTTVTVTATDASGNRSTCSFTVTVGPLGADLSITNTDSPDPVTLGHPLTYTVTIRNNGPSAATDVWAVHTVLGFAQLVSASSSQGRCSGIAGLVVCNPGTLASGATATVRIVVTPWARGNLSSTASALSSATDPHPANNQAAATTRVR